MSKVFGGSVESWLAQQAQYDLAHVRDQMKLKRLERTHCDMTQLMAARSICGLSKSA
jgi:plasmid maintenance system antidote protein VapI